MAHIICTECGYDLAGLNGADQPDFICPECGRSGPAEPGRAAAVAKRAQDRGDGLVIIAILFAVPACFVAGSLISMPVVWAVFSIAVWRALTGPRWQGDAGARAAVSIASGLLVTLLLLILVWASAQILNA